MVILLNNALILTVQHNCIALYAVSKITHDFESRPKWDKLFPTIEVVESFENHKIVYW